MNQKGIKKESKRNQKGINEESKRNQKGIEKEPIKEPVRNQ